MLIAGTWENGPDRIDIELGAPSRTSFCAPGMPKPDPLPCQSSFHLEASFPDDRPPFLERSRGAISCPRSTMCLRTDGSANLSPTAERAADEMPFGAHTVAWLRRVGFQQDAGLPRQLGRTLALPIYPQADRVSLRSVGRRIS
jgi:hypothetical protein